MTKQEFIRILDYKYPFLGVYYRSNPIPEDFFNNNLDKNDWKILAEKYFSEVITKKEVDYQVCKLVKIAILDSAIPKNLIKRILISDLEKTSLDGFLFYKELVSEKQGEDWLKEISHLELEDQFLLIKNRYFKDKNLVEILTKDKYSDLVDKFKQMRKESLEKIDLLFD